MVAHVFPARYRPAQKTDSLGESGSHSSLHSTPEQAMAAQSQHHQQYIGEPPPPPPLPPPPGTGPVGKAPEPLSTSGVGFGTSSI